MYIVIFRATVRETDAEYAATAERMRRLARDEFGCTEFHSVTDGTTEVSLSYWPSEDHIRAWKAHPEHMFAQRRARERWYETWSVEVTEVVRAYRGAP